MAWAKTLYRQVRHIGFQQVTADSKLAKNCGVTGFSAALDEGHVSGISLPAASQRHLPKHAGVCHRVAGDFHAHVGQLPALGRALGVEENIVVPVADVFGLDEIGTRNALRLLILRINQGVVD